MALLDYTKFNNRGMTCCLRYFDDTAVLTIICAGYRIDVYGPSTIGTVYTGGRLDTVIDAMPRPGADVSALFAGDTMGIGPKYTMPIINALKIADNLSGDIYG